MRQLEYPTSLLHGLNPSPSNGPVLICCWPRCQVQSCGATWRRGGDLGLFLTVLRGCIDPNIKSSQDPIQMMHVRVCVWLSVSKLSLSHHSSTLSHARRRWKARTHALSNGTIVASPTHWNKTLGDKDWHQNAHLSPRFPLICCMMGNWSRHG